MCWYFIVGGEEETEVEMGKVESSICTEEGFWRADVEESIDVTNEKGSEARKSAKESPVEWREGTATEGATGKEAKVEDSEVKWSLVGREEISSDRGGVEISNEELVGDEVEVKELDGWSSADSKAEMWVSASRNGVVEIKVSTGDEERMLRVDVSMIDEDTPIVVASELDWKRGLLNLDVIEDQLSMLLPFSLSRKVTKM